MPTKRRRGRPTVDSEPISLRLPKHMLSAIDEWRDKQVVPPKRVDVVRYALGVWLKQKGLLK